MANEWLRYANQGATRNLPLDPRLVQAMQFLPQLGLSMEVFSGGQPAAGGGARVGSVRHDHGGAADVFFHQGDRRLDWANPADQPVFGDIVRRARAAGVTGFGAGPGYMQPGSMHLGFGNPGVWGAGGKSANAADWLRAAYVGSAAGPTAQAATPSRPANSQGGLSDQMAPQAAAPTMFGDFVAPRDPAPAADFGSVVAQFLANRQQSQQQQETDAAAERARKLALFG